MKQWVRYHCSVMTDSAATDVPFIQDLLKYKVVSRNKTKYRRLLLVMYGSEKWCVTNNQRILRDIKKKIT